MASARIQIRTTAERYVAKNILGFLTALAAVSAAYVAYALTVVPLIEPGEKPLDLSLVDRPNGAVVDEILAPELRSLFPENSWEQTSTKVLETSRGFLLFQDHQQLPDGRLEVSPLSMVLQGEKPGDRTVILRAQEGAVLKFDQPLDLASHKLGKLIQARLLGRVTISSPPTKLGADDAISIQTSYVQIDEMRIWTGNDVGFRFGPHSGSGRDLTIALAPESERSNSDDKLAAVESITLAYVERISLSIANGDFFGDDRLKTTPTNLPESKSPVYLTCRGPFQFDVAKMIATFENRVLIERPVNETTVDQLQSDRLEFHLAQSTDQTANQSAEAAKSSAWRIARVKATGNPVRLIAPSQRSSASGRYFEYDFRSRQITLEDKQQVVINRDGRQFKAKQLVYALGEPGQIGRLIAKGPGEFSGIGQSAKVSGNWGDKLQLRPREGKQVLSLSGGSRIMFEPFSNNQQAANNLIERQRSAANSIGKAEFSADMLHVWMTEQPPQPGVSTKPGDAPRLSPEVISALGNVHLESAQLVVNTRQLEAFVQTSDAPIQAEEANANTGVAGLMGRTAGTARDDRTAEKKFTATSNLVRLRLLSVGDRTLLDRVNLSGDASIVESASEVAGQTPLSLTGKSIDIASAHNDRTELHVIGEPAQFSARGLALVGTNIHLHRGYNRLWMTGAGEMRLPAPRNLGGAVDQGVQMMSVVFRDGLEFDGQLLRCSREVKVTGERQFALAETLAVELNQKILFGNVNPNMKPEAVRFALEGGAFMENRVMEGNQLASIDRLKGETLTIDRTSGEIRSIGPGWVSTVRRGGGADWLSADGANERAPQAPSNQLVYLHNEFQKEMVGNIISRDIRFLVGVRTTYGPVNGWSDTLTADRPGGLGPKGIQLSSDQLRIFEFGPQVTPQRKAIEVEATGNVFIEGRDYSARASRVSFVEAKQMVVLDGDARTDAELIRRDPRTGAESKAAAEKIKFWPKRNDFHVDDARYLDLSQLPDSSG